MPEGPDSRKYPGRNKVNSKGVHIAKGAHKTDSKSEMLLRLSPLTKIRHAILHCMYVSTVCSLADPSMFAVGLLRTKDECITVSTTGMQLSPFC